MRLKFCFAMALVFLILIMAAGNASAFAPTNIKITPVPVNIPCGGTGVVTVEITGKITLADQQGDFDIRLVDEDIFRDDLLGEVTISAPIGDPFIGGQVRTFTRTFEVRCVGCTLTGIESSGEGEADLAVEIDNGRIRDFTNHYDSAAGGTVTVRCVKTPRVSMIESTDDDGDKKDKFIEGDLVYVSGYDFPSVSPLNLYVVEDESWINGMKIPDRVLGTIEEVNINAGGCISPEPTLIWPSGVQGKYDIIVDVDGNGNYDEGIDALDDMDVNDAGFEVPTLTTIGLMALIGLLLVVTMSRIKRQ